MGLKPQDVDFLLASIRKGVSLDRVLMVGRQTLYVEPRELNRLLTKHGFVPGEAGASRGTSRFAPGQRLLLETLLHQLGAGTVEALDISDYDGAGVIHDLNHPIPPELAGRYDLLFDGGSLEHVFNFPVAIKNYMDLVKPGGHLFVHIPANNFFGHGFYQFSPELFYRVLSAENGYRVERMVAFEDVPGGKKYEVADPAAIGSRVELVNRRRVLLMVHGVKLRTVPVFRTYPLQSDYIPVWGGPGNGTPAPADDSAGTESGGGLAARLKERLKKSCPGLTRALRYCLSPLLQRNWARQEELRRQPSLNNRRFFRPVGNS